jgi:hypothetical protein
VVGRRLALFKCPGQNTFHHNFNLKLFELVATLAGVESLRLARITAVIRSA